MQSHVHNIHGSRAGDDAKLQLTIDQTEVDKVFIIAIAGGENYGIRKSSNLT